MILQKNSFGLDYIHYASESGDAEKLPLKEGMTFVAKDGIAYVDVAYIKWSDAYDDCYLETIGDRLQTYVVTYEQYADFVYLLDEAYYTLGLLCRGDKRKDRSGE